MPSDWPALPYEAWSATCDTLHAHTQVLGKLASTLAPPEPQLQHAALRLTARGWETLPLPAPDGSGAFVVALDLREPRGGRRAQRRRARRVALTPDRPVGEVTREVLAAVRELGGPGRDQPHAAGDAVDDAARRGRRARDLRPGAGRRLLRGGDARRAGARRAPRALPRPLDAGQRLVGLVRPRGEPLLRRSRPSRRREDFIMRNAMDARRSPSAGGPATRATARPPSTPTPIRRRTGSRRRRSRPRPPAGTRRSASTSSTGTTSAQRRTRSRPRSGSAAPWCSTPAGSAAGTPRWPPAPRAIRRLSAERNRATTCSLGTRLPVPAGRCQPRA